MVAESPHSLVAPDRAGAGGLVVGGRRESIGKPMRNCKGIVPRISIWKSIGNSVGNSMVEAILNSIRNSAGTFIGGMNTAWGLRWEVQW